MNGTLAARDVVGPAAVDAFGNVYATGVFRTATGSRVVVLKLAGTAVVWRYESDLAFRGNQAGLAVAVDPAGHPVVAFAAPAPDSILPDWVVAKIDRDTGEAIWTTTIDGDASGFDVLLGVTADESGDVLATGGFADAMGATHFAVVKLAGASGGELWRYVPLNAAPYEVANDVETATGAIFVCGTRDATFMVERLDPETGMSMWANPVVAGVALDLAVNGAVVDVTGLAQLSGRSMALVRVAAADGALVWNIVVFGDDSSPFADNIGVAVAAARDGSGDAFIAGNVSNDETHRDLFVARLSDDVSAQWTATFDGGQQQDDNVLDLAVDAANRPVVSGAISSSFSAESNGILRQLDPATGAPTWTVVLDGTAHDRDRLDAVVPDASDGVVAIGTTFDVGNDDQLVALRVRAADGVETGRLVTGGEGFDAADLPGGVARDPAGDIVVAGRVQNRTPTRTTYSSEFTVAKLDGRRGLERWRYTLPGSDGVAAAVATDAAGNVVAAGRAQGASDNDPTVVKLSPDGAALWIRQFPGIGKQLETATAIAVGDDGSVYVTGQLQQPTTGNDLFVVKLGPDGTERWRRVHAEPGGSDDSAVAIAIDAAGDVVVGGNADGSWLVMRLAGADGAVRWSTTVGGMPAIIGSYFSTLTLDPGSSDVLAVGSLGNQTGDLAVVRLAAATGQEIWRATYDGSAAGEDSAYGVAVNGAGDILVAGHLANVGNSGDAVVIRLGSDKTPRWKHTVQVQEEGFSLARDVAFDPDGNVVVAATIAGGGEYANDIVFVGIDGAGGNEIWRSALFDGSEVRSADVVERLLVDAAGGITAVGRIERAGTSVDIAAIRLAARGVDAACVKTGPGDPDCRPCEAGCDDGEPCTADGCDATSFCASTPVAGDEALTCAFARTMPPAACSGARVPRKVAKTFRRAGNLTGKGLDAKTEAKAERAFRRASRQLGRLLSFLDKAERRRRRPLPAACTAALRALVGDAKTRVDARLAG